MDTVGYLPDCSNTVVWKGDIIRVRRLFYWHYGIVLSEDAIIHYSSYPFHWWQRPVSVRKVGFKEFFNNGKRLEIYYRAASSLERNIIVKNAMLRIGEEQYSLLFNNCKDFVEDCKMKGNHNESTRSIHIPRKIK